MTEFNPEKSSLPLHGRRLKTPDAARYCGVSTALLRKYRTKGATGGPEYIRLGTAIIYSTDSLDRWMAGNRFNGGRPVAA